MKKLLIILLLISQLFAQANVGLAPEDISSIKEYQLPDWQYSTLLLDFNGMYTNNDRETSYENKLNENGDFILRTLYQTNSECENKITNLSLFADLGCYFSYYENEDTRRDEYYDKNKHSNNANRAILSAQYLQKKYLDTKKYLLSKINAGFEFSESEQSNRYYEGYPASFNYKSEYNTISRPVRVNVLLGVGFGKVRNVTPVIRALRLNKRFQSLGKSASLSRDEIFEVAKHFSKYSAYSAYYDRPARFFWDDMGKMLSSNLENMTAYEQYYLSDVLLEKTGTRLEGAEVNMGIQSFFFNSTFDTNNGPDLRIEENEVGGFISGRAYKNVSVRLQLGVEADAYYGYVLNDNTFKEDGGFYKVIVSKLFNISDRLFWESRVGYGSRFAYYKPFDDKKWVRNNNFAFETNFSYYIEDNIDLYVSYSFDKQDFSPTGSQYMFFNYEHLTPNPYRHPYFESDIKKFYSKIRFGIKYYMGWGLR